MKLLRDFGDRKKGDLAVVTSESNGVLFGEPIKLLRLEFRSPGEMPVRFLFNDEVEVASGV